MTGASAGFGREIAAMALAEGHRVAVTARDPTRVADLVEGAGPRAVGVKLDVTGPREVESAVAEAEAHFGQGIDVLVNAAGYGLISAVEEVSDAELRLLMETHFFGVITLIRAVLPGMRQRRRGHIFNFSSIAGVDPTPGTAHYSAAKFAIEGLSEGLAKETAAFDIKITVVEPGRFQTSFFAGPGGQTEATVIDDYVTAVGPYRALIANPPDWCPGDPKRAAEEIARLALTEDPPLRLPLGRIAFEAVTAALKRRLSEAEAYRAVSLATDFPEFMGRIRPPEHAFGHRQV